MRIAVIGNSGSGKSTLASGLATELRAATLDLDTVFWEPNQIAVPRNSAAARADVAAFCGAHEQWVIEGCYASLAEASFPFAPVLIFLNASVETCIAHCRARPWEPHKYASEAEQDERLEFLLQWVASYPTRDDDMSLKAHRRVFDGYPGKKLELNERMSAPALLKKLSG
ncbi:MAG: AAA family ATPase [Betaproteobacteria bacterium]|nr:AAA family ATPase [Betaproteobacteria bacterium]